MTPKEVEKVLNLAATCASEGYPAIALRYLATAERALWAQLGRQMEAREAARGRPGLRLVAGGGEG
jgi:hypothetical protein